jgi:hypothetical protein
VVTAEKGWISKSEVSEYTVTLELANPYPTPISTRVLDQWPVSGDKEVQIELVRVEPDATRDPVKGALEWRLTVPPSGKSTLRFVYTVRRPKGWRLHQ